jgi:hypothetical protein
LDLTPILLIATLRYMSSIKDHRQTETVPVRVTKTRYKELCRIAKANGHTISWLLNYALDLYFQSLSDPAPKFPPKEQP